MKKEIPNLLKVEFPYDPDSDGDLLLWRFGKIIEDGHAFSKHDFNLFCALLIRKHGVEKLSDDLQNYILDGDKINPDVQFQLTAYAIEVGDDISEEELEIHAKARYERALYRYNFVKKEIHRTGINAHKVNLDNSEDYRTLVNQVAGFDDLTLIDWFVPIVLTFEKFVHIYVKHVEETKFGEGQFKRRSFIDYRHDELLTLIKQILRIDEENIKDHFLEVRAAQILNEPDKIKDYHRGFGKFAPIEMDGDKFRLTIDKNGFITSFYQIK
jgi:hypothetical protein